MCDSTRRRGDLILAFSLTIFDISMRQCVSWLHFAFWYSGMLTIRSRLKRFTHGWIVRMAGNNEGWFARLTALERSLGESTLVALRSGPTLLEISRYARAVEKLARRWFDIRSERERMKREKSLRGGADGKWGWRTATKTEISLASEGSAGMKEGAGDGEG